MAVILNHAKPRRPWNKDRLFGQRPPVKPREVWAIRVRLQITNMKRDLVLFNLSLDSKLRGWGLLNLKVSDVRSGGDIRSRAEVMQKKAGNPMQFEIMDQCRGAIVNWCEFKELEQYD
jgi:hypothetical protein